MVDGEVATRYGASGAKVRLIRAGQGGASVMEATLDGTLRALRLSGPDLSQRPERVEFEGTLLETAKRAGVGVAAALRGVDGQFGQPIDGRIALLTEWATGDVEWPTPPAKAQRLGASVARLHAATDCIEFSGGLRSFGTDGLLDRPLTLLSQIADVAPLRPYIEEMRTRIDAIERTPVTFGPIHGDIHQGNCHFDGDEATLFDFAQCGIGWRAFDLAGFLWAWRDDTIQQPPMRSACDAYLAGYRSVRPLTDGEERALPALVRVRDLWEAGEWVAVGDGLTQPEAVCNTVTACLDHWSAHPMPDRL